MSVRTDVVAELRAAADGGATLLELLEIVRRATGTAAHVRGTTMGYFEEAFGLRPLDFTETLFACEIFGDGASVPLETTEQRFRELLEARAAGRSRGARILVRAKPT